MNNSILRYQLFEEGQEQIVSTLIWDVFYEFEASDYSEEGIKTFKAFSSPERLINEVRNNGFKIYCCFEKDMLVGVVGLRSVSHISLLFVKKSHHRRGIAKKLLDLAIREAFQVQPDIQELTVNSSSYAVDIYRKLGFFSTDTMQEKDGIIYMPMKKSLINT